MAKAKITIRKIKGGYGVFKNGKLWHGPYNKDEATNAARFMRESKYS